ncbi:MAG TPA: S1/P1 nuclease [Longimicrobium sp.]|jgi:hypothetical protein
MKRLFATALALAGALLSATPARAWDEVGHKVVARIAWDHMTPRAREQAVALLMAAPEDAGIRALMPGDDRPLADRQRDLFVNTSVWADLIRTRTHPGSRYAHSDWHYVNFFWEQRTPGGRIIDRPDVPRAGELLNRMAVYGTSLGNASLPQAERAVDLAWTLHLVGDGHQPMHNSARITPQDTAGDRGANSFTLAGLYPFNNLHAFWDSLVGFSVPWSVADRTEEDYVGSVARRIAADYPQRTLAGKLRPGAFEEWSREGMRIAQRVGYPVWLVRGERAPMRYRFVAWDAAEPRVAIAGYRLADLLNRTLGS